MPSEEKWYALTGRVVHGKVEADGDIHLTLKMPPETTSEPLAPRFRWEIHPVMKLEVIP